MAPANGERLNTRLPTLVVQNAVGRYVTAAFDDRFEVFEGSDDASSPILTGLVAQGEATTSYTVPTALKFDTLYSWRARAEFGSAVGPWSTTATFVTPGVPPPGTLSFTDVTIAAGLPGLARGGHGAMFADATGDGLPDLYITRNLGALVPDLFFVSRGPGRFSEEGATRGIEDFDYGSHGAVWADLDNDGDYDLVNGTTYSALGEGAPNSIFRNDGNGFFTNVTPAGMAARAEATRAVLALDMDRDGDLDLFTVSGWKGSGDPAGERNEVYRNDGGMRFSAITTGALSLAPAGQGATDTDYDGDGDIDIIAGNRDGALNILRNDGQGNFVQVSPEAIGIRHRAYSAITMGDIDADGDLDLLLVDLIPVTEDTIAHLYRNSGGGRFVFDRDFSGFGGFSGGLADLDNDGDLDLAFAGDTKVYLNDGQGHFSAGPALPISDIRGPRSIAFADVDEDGDLDFAVTAKSGRSWLVRNDLDSGLWLKVKLRSSNGQAGAFGTKVWIYPAGRAGSLPLGLREARSNSGYLAQSDPVLHFGLGSHAVVDVIVSFLDGLMRIRVGVAANQTITIDGSVGGAAPVFIERGDARPRSARKRDY